jgi:mono/diheme cytochrome c family protein
MSSISGLFVATALTIAFTGCRQDMQDQPKFLPLRGTSFFVDGRSARNQVPGTVARSQAETGSYFQTGLVDGKEGDGMPIPVTTALLARGQERYNVYCSPCHSRVGNGEGMIVQRGYYQAANFQSERLRQAPLGHFVTVIRGGYGAMPMYATELPPMDRWAVAAYIRALQLSQNAKAADAPGGVALVPLKRIATEEGLSETLAQDSWGIQAAKSHAILAMSTAKTDSAAPGKTAEATTPSPNEQSPAASAKDDKSEQAPPKAARASARDSAAGKLVYTANCQMCHQASRAGNPPIIPSLLDIVSRVGNEHVHEVIVNGVPGGHPPMPAFGDRLSSTYIDNLISYLRSR